MNTHVYRLLQGILITTLIVVVIAGLAYSLFASLKTSPDAPSLQELFTGVLNKGADSPTHVQNTNQITVPPLTEDIRSIEERVISLVERATPSVVSIVLTKELPVYEQFRESPFHDPFICQFMGPEFCDDFSIPKLRQQGTQEQQVGAGSGFFVRSDGLIMTNKHVVLRDDVSYTVVTNDGTKYEARIVARDPINDLALLSIEGSGFPVLPLGNAGHVRLGETVIAIGNALGEFRNTVSKGIVSGLSRSIIAQGSLAGPEHLSGLIQTDAAINPGNSGGPLLNLTGEIIGINTAIAGGAQSVGFALPIDVGKRILDQYEREGKISYPFLGVRYMIITPEFAQAQNLPVNYGALIVRGDTPQDIAVVPGSPADKIGLRENDIILELDGERVTLDSPLDALITSKRAGDEVTLKVYTQGQEKTLKVELGERS